MQYLYGSGEAAAISIQAWRGLVGYVAQQVKSRPAKSVLLTPSLPLDQAQFRDCGTDPMAVVLDVDETVLLNLGFEYDAALHPGPYDPARWTAWEESGSDKVAAVPGAAKALAVIRSMGVAVIFNSNRSAQTAARTQAAIEGAGLGPAVRGETLFLQGDDRYGTKKDHRRQVIAAKYCIIAMVGDQLGDFSDKFNDITSPADRRAATLAPPIASKWGAGWFVMPNPVYGSGLKGGFDDVFPQDKRWAAPQPQEKQ